jgi:protein-tyrosine kinase
MSRNFELLQQAEAERRLSPILELRSEPALVSERKEEPEHSFDSSWDRLAQEESLKLVQRIFLQNGPQSTRAVAFAGIDQGNGCTRVCANAALTLATSVSGSVCLVDANLRAPGLATLFGVGNHYGFTDALRREGPIRSFMHQLQPENLLLLSCGSSVSDSSVFLDSERLKARLAELRETVDYTLIDAPPLIKYADGSLLGHLVDGVILVLEANSTRRESALTVTENLRAAGVQVLGAVLNKRTFPIPELLYRRL